MNHSYRLIFSSTTSTLIPVAENARGQGKANRRSSASQFKSNQTGFTLRFLCVALAIAWGGKAHALPQGGQVSSGSGSISQSSNNMTVQQNSQNLSINWQSFGIGAGQTVQFKQPSASSIALNRVLGQDPSKILGTLSANGQVFITNPNGVLFGHGAQVNVGGLVASTGNLTDADFQAKHYRFSINGTGGTVTNDGTLHAADGGYIALLAPQVRNKGVISARLGTVLLGAGDQTTLKLDNGSLVGYNIDKGAINALADNKQLIQADGGQVIMSAKAADQLARAVVNNSGVIEARTLQNKEGVIRLLGDTKAGEVNLKGTLDASAANGGNGGSIDTSAENVNVAKSAHVTTAAPNGKTGDWLITQSNNFNVDKDGNISGDTLGKSLDQTNVSVRTLSSPTQSGDIAVNDFVEWLSSNNLTLRSHRDIDVNATIANRSGGNLLLRADATGNGTGTINFGTAGNINQTGGRTDLYYNPVSYTTPTDFTSNIIGSFTGWMLVNDVDHLQAINTNLSGNYALGKNINASATASWNGGAGFVPIGGRFYGQFDGLNHTISNLHINRPTESNVGLFRSTFGEVSNVGLVHGSVTGASNVGGVVGGLAHLDNVFYTGTVTGSGTEVGGLVGFPNEQGHISNSWSDATVTGDSNVGGLAGSSRFGGVIEHSYAKGTVTGNTNVGGLVGLRGESSIEDSWSNATVTGDSNVGGLIGLSRAGGGIDHSYAKGTVTGTTNVGGLVGLVQSTFVRNSWSSAKVTGQSAVGGLVGNNDQGSIDHVFSTGTITGSGEGIGGLVGANSGTISNAFSTSTVSGDSYVGGLVGESSGTLRKVFHVGAVSGRSQIGGLVGGNIGTINEAFSIGKVSGTDSMVGGLVGRNLNGTISDVFSSGTVTGNEGAAGGLVGYVDSGNISNAYSSGTVTGKNNVGGLVGVGADRLVNITDAHSTANVTGSGGLVGGLVGQYTYGTISNSSATGKVTGDSGVGGLVGVNHHGTISKSYSTGAVKGNTDVGGLVGNNGGTIQNAYAKGKVNGYTGPTGGLVGLNRGTITSTYSTGKVTGSADVGGLVGRNDGGTVTSSYWDTDTSGQATSDGATGLTDSQMKHQANFAGFDFANVWSIHEGSSTPFFK